MMAKNDRGQALIELCFSLVGLMAIFVAVIFVAGGGIGSIQALLSSRKNAEQLANTSNHGGAGQNIVLWDYGKDKISFTADDYAVKSGSATGGGAGNFDQEINNALTSAADSWGAAQTDKDLMYTFRSLNSINNLNAQWISAPPDMFLGAAELVRGEPNLNPADQIYTLRRNQYNTAKS
ncbi:MAG: hypothetical protein RRY34_07290, partial [Victivallaceae bacterium]